MDGLVTLLSWYVTVVPAGILAADRVMYGDPAVALLIVNPVAPVCALNVAAVVTKPVGFVHVPAASRQY